MIKWCFTILLIISYTSSVTASFLYGQPCSDRNTAYLYSTTWILPVVENDTKCVDITGYRNPNLVDYSAFFQLVSEADTFYADHMNLTRFPIHIIASLPRLETIDLSGNYIRRVPYKMRKISPRISKLLLAENSVFVPKKRPLFKSASITMLMLSRNRITNIFPITFSKMPYLEILYLDGNRIRYISADIFAPLFKLQYLHLGHNAIELFPSNTTMPKLLKYYITKDQKKVIK